MKDGSSPQAPRGRLDLQIPTPTQEMSRLTTKPTK